MDLEELQSEDIKYDILWKSNRIESSIKSFITKLTKRYSDAEWAYSRKDNQAEDLTYEWGRLWKRIKKQRGISCLSLKDSRNLIMQVKCLSNCLPTLSELNRWKPELYKSGHCIMCKEELPEDLDHLMRCKVLQEAWEEIEEATIQSIAKLRNEEKDNAEVLREVKEILLPKEKEQRFQRRKELVTGLIKGKMSKDLLTLASGEERKKLWIDSILFIMQRSFSEIIWNMWCEKVNRWEKKEGITSKEKRSKPKEKELEVRIRTVEEKEAVRVRRKRERGRKKEWIEGMVDEAVRGIIKRGEIVWWSFL